MDVSIAIPTYRRGAILLETLHALESLDPRPLEVLVVDQTPEHDDVIESELSRFEASGRIRRIRLTAPSITGAMNRALQEAAAPIVLFLDDDVVPDSALIAGHRAAYGDAGVHAVVGMVLQPGEVEIDETPRGARSGFLADLEFAFNSTRSTDVASVIACNLSVRKDAAIAIGGFDENFVRVAYRFETDFARRVVDAGGRVRFEPSAKIRHLKAPTGGTRAFGDHKRESRPDHCVGDYYFAQMHATTAERVPYILRRLRRNVLTRFHARHPWLIPAKLLGEIRGFLEARQLARGGRKLM